MTDIIEEIRARHEVLENQIPAQDCEIEYWLQQAENYAAVQIPADDLRAIIARTYAAVNALPELPEMLAKVKRLEEALTFYAARENYNDEPLPNNMWKTAKAVFDGGKRARAALKETGQ